MDLTRSWSGDDNKNPASKWTQTSQSWLSPGNMKPWFLTWNQRGLEPWGNIQTPWYRDKLTPIPWPEILLNPFCPVFLLFTTMLGVNRNAVSVGALYGQACPGLWHRLWQMCLMWPAITMLMTMRPSGGTSEKKWASLPSLGLVRVLGCKLDT